MKSLFTSFGFLRLLALGTVLFVSLATAQAGWCPAPKGGDGTIYSNSVHCRQSSKRDLCTHKHGSKCYKNSCKKCCKNHCRR